MEKRGEAEKTYAGTYPSYVQTLFQKRAISEYCRKPVLKIRALKMQD